MCKYIISHSLTAHPNTSTVNLLKYMWKCARSLVPLYTSRTVRPMTTTVNVPYSYSHTLYLLYVYREKSLRMCVCICSRRCQVSASFYIIQYLHIFIFFFSFSSFGPTNVRVSSRQRHRRFVKQICLLLIRIFLSMKRARFSLINTIYIFLLINISLICTAYTLY